MRAATSPGVGGMWGRSRGGLSTSAAKSTVLVMLKTRSTPSIRLSASVTRAIFSIVAGAKMSSARTPTTPTSSLPKMARVRA